MNKVVHVRFLLSIFFFLFFSLAHSQDTQTEKTLHGFLDIKWNESLETAKKKLLKRKGINLDLKNTNSEQLVARGGEIGGERVSSMHLSFTDNMFTGAIVFFQEVPKHKILSKYKSIKELLIEKYGNPDIDAYEFKSPYYDGDGYETQAIRLGKGTVASVWEFPVEGKEGYTITLVIKDNLSIQLGYINWDKAQSMLRDDKRKRSREF